MLFGGVTRLEQVMLSVFKGKRLVIVLIEHAMPQKADCLQAVTVPSAPAGAPTQGSDSAHQQLPWQQQCC